MDSEGVAYICVWRENNVLAVLVPRAIDSRTKEAADDNDGRVNFLNQFLLDLVYVVDRLLGALGDGGVNVGLRQLEALQRPLVELLGVPPYSTVTLLADGPEHVFDDGGDVDARSSIKAP